MFMFPCFLIYSCFPLHLYSAAGPVLPLLLLLLLLHHHCYLHLFLIFFLFFHILFPHIFSCSFPPPPFLFLLFLLFVLLFLLLRFLLPPPRCSITRTSQASQQEHNPGKITVSHLFITLPWLKTDLLVGNIESNLAFKTRKNAAAASPRSRLFPKEDDRECGLFLRIFTLVFVMLECRSMPSYLPSHPPFRVHRILLVTTQVVEKSLRLCSF